MPLVLMLGAVLFLMSGTLLYSILQTARGQAAGIDSSGAYWLARSGIELARTRLALDASWATTSPVTVQVPFDQGTGSFTVNVTRETINFEDLWQVAATGVRGGATRRLVAALRPDTFSRYSYITNYETTELGSTVWFMSSDVLNGPVFTNDQFSMYDAPVFHGTVRSVNSTYRHYSSTAANTEYVSTGNNAALAPIPTTDLGFAGDQAEEETLFTAEGRDAVMTTLRTKAVSGGTLVNWESGTRYDVTLDGTTVRIRKTLPTPAGTEHVVELSTMPNRVVYIEGAATVHGSLDGRLTVASTGNMTITDNVRYRFRTESGATQDDMLGLISRTDIILDQNLPNNTTVDASVLALGERFYFAGNGYAGNPSVLKGTLQVYGGIAQVRRGVMGLSSGGTRVAGFAKDYRYDSRLSSQGPPFFPRLKVNGDPRLVVVAMRDLQSLSSEP